MLDTSRCHCKNAVEAILSQGSFRDAVVNHLFQQLHQQCVTLCWKSTPSLLHGVDASRTVAQIHLQPDN